MQTRYMFKTQKRDKRDRRDKMLMGFVRDIEGCTSGGSGIRRRSLELFLFIFIASLVGCAPESRFPGGKIVDLSHDYSERTIFWPTSERFIKSTVYEGQTPGGYYYSSYKFSVAEHGGTHVDAPVHFAQGRQSVDQIPLERLLGPAAVIDVSAQCSKNPDYQVSENDIRAWEKTNGELPRDIIVLLYTGYSKRWPDAKAYLGTDKRGAAGVAELHFPGLGPQAARFLAEKRKIAAIGLDTASIDYGQSKLFESHRILNEQNIPAFENVANLDKLPARGAMVVALPMKIKGGSGGPLRIIGILPR